MAPDMAYVLILLFSAVLLVTSLGQRRYDGYHVLRITPTTEEDVAALNQWDGQVDFWSRPSVPGKPVAMVVAPSDVEPIIQTLDRQGIPYEIINTNLEDDIQRERLESTADENRGHRRTINLFEYNRISDINAWLDTVAEDCDFCTVFTVGTSTEGRPLRAMKIATPGINKKAIWIDAGIHAREWIAPATAVYIIDQLVNHYETDVRTRLVVDAFDWYVLPSMNPDGYEYTWTVDRLWRKTRSILSESSCVGTDPNRNWDYHWMEIGASSYPCSDIFGGPRPFSEPETSSVADFLYENRADFLVYLTFHSYGQYWLTPWGYTEDFPDDYSDLYKVAKLATNALREVHGTPYTVGTSTNVLYAAAGGSDDWAKGVAGIKFSYTVELRDVDSYGFMLPASQIRPTGEETWAGVKALAWKLGVLRH